MVAQSPERQVASFLAKFSPDVARAARAAHARVRKLLPSAFELVYDNYNALALAFGPTERTSQGSADMLCGGATDPAVGGRRVR